MITNLPLAMAAVFTGIAGVMTSYAAIVSARRRANEECEKQLKIQREEAEVVSRELHRARMRLAAWTGESTKEG